MLRHLQKRPAGGQPAGSEFWSSQSELAEDQRAVAGFVAWRIRLRVGEERLGRSSAMEPSCPMSGFFHAGRVSRTRWQREQGWFLRLHTLANEMAVELLSHPARSLWSKGQCMELDDPRPK